MGGTRPRLLTRVPSLAGALDRPRLLELIGSVPVVAIAAPPGSGTTTLAAQIAAAGAGTTAWCRLAPGFDHLVDLVESTAQAVSGDAGAGDAVAPASPRVLEAAEQLLDLLETGPVTLVVDDHHFAGSGDIDRVIAECAALVPSGSRIVVAGASRPAGLIGLIPPQQIVVVDADDLAFTHDESVALFEALGSHGDRAADWHRAVGGWAQAMVAGACSPDGDPAAHLDTVLDQLTSAEDDTAVLEAAAALPYLTGPIVTALGGDEATLDRLVAESPLLTDHDGFVRMSDEAAERLRARLDDGRVTRLRVAAANVLVSSDPVTAIDVLLDADHPEQAADVLADHLSEIGVERALTWLYRLPADLRRRFPPVLAAGQATVEVDTALANAQLRVETADSERSRREALLALGSVEAHRGELAAAATALEAALRSSRDDPHARGRISYELARTRFLLGDVTGARVALDDAEDSSAARLLAVQLDVVDGRPTLPPPEGEDADADAARAIAALVADDLEAADEASTRAHASGVEAGGEALVAGATVRAVTLLRTGRADDAELVVDEMERRLGARHRLSRVIGAVIRERISRDGGDRGRHERDERRLRDHRQSGYALVERMIDVLLDGHTEESTADGPGVIVRVLGEHVVEVDDRTVRRGEWKSKKALEVLTVLAAASPRGARREVLIEEVWPGRDPDKGRTLLRTALSEVRRRLEPGRPTGEPSTHLETAEDVIRLDGRLDLDLAEDLVSGDPVAAFTILACDLAPEVESAEWAQDWIPRVERLRVAAASAVPETAAPVVRIEALEALVAAEPWKRDHYDRLAALHRASGDDAAAADVERRWFADDA